MNAPVRADAEPLLEDFPYRLSDNVRFADLDPNGHVNNATYASYFETGRVTLMKDRAYGLLPAGLRLGHGAARHAISAPSCTGRARSNSGSASVKFGRTSVSFDQVVFSEGKCVGLGARRHRADRRGDAQADAAHRRRSGRNSSRWMQARLRRIMKRAAWLVLALAPRRHAARRRAELSSAKNCASRWRPQARAASRRC